MDYDYYGSSSGADGAGLVFLGGLFFAALLFGLAIYVVTSIFLMKLLSNAGHKTPGAAWVPIWNSVSLMEIGGIRQPWIWTLVLFGGSIFSNLIPFIGQLIAIALIVPAIILTVYLAKGVQAGVGTGSTGGIILAILLPLVWIIWMAIASGRGRYNRDAAISEGGALPMNWFGDSDPYAPFGYAQPAAPIYQQPAAYAQPQYAQPEPPQHPAAPQANAWSAETPSFAGSAEQNHGNASEVPSSEDIPTPPAPPRFSAPLPPRSLAESEDEEGNRPS